MGGNIIFLSPTGEALSFLNECGFGPIRSGPAAAGWELTEEGKKSGIKLDGFIKNVNASHYYRRSDPWEVWGQAQGVVDSGILLGRKVDRGWIIIFGSDFYQQNETIKEVLHNLKNLSGMVLPKIDEIKAAEKSYFYRNKMEYTFSNQRWLTEDEIKLKNKTPDKNGLGLHKSGMWDKVVDIEKCHLQKDPANNIRNSVKKFALDNNLAFFNPREKSGFLRTLMIRNSNQGEFMVLIQFYRENKEQREAILNHLKDKFHLTALLYCINSKANDTLYDQEIIIYDGSEFITEVMEGLKFRVNAKSFFQTNAEQAYELYKITREFAGLKGHELVYDLYTGTGTIALFIAGKCKKVVGVESVPEAVAVAKENAEINGIKNTFFEVGDMRKVFNLDFINRHGVADLVITDPPRNGMHPDVIRHLLVLAPNKIVYISCNNATQARDLSLMKEKYKLSKCQALDMFPQTQHIENVVLLEKI